MKQVIVKTQKELRELAKWSHLTFEGCLVEELDTAYTEWFNDHGVDVSNATAYIISGKLMNSTYKLTNSNAYPEDLHIVAIEGLDCSNIIISRFEIGGRWLDDVVANNRAVQREINRRNRIA